MKVFEEIKNYIKENMEWINYNNILINSPLDSIGFDSLSLMMLLVFLENKYNVDTNIVILENNQIKTIKDIIDMLNLDN